MRNRSMALAIVLTMILFAACTSQNPLATPLPQQALLRSAQQQAAFEIDTLIENAPTEMGWWGVKVQYANTGEVIYERNPAKLFMPASNMKMYTTAAALWLLGPQYRYETDFLIQGTLGANGHLDGDLIIQGSGDPTWSWRFYDGNYDSVMVRIVDSLKTNGITSISGSIIGDDNIFDDQDLGYGWSWDDEPYYYAAQLSGLSFNENYIDFKIIPDTLNPGNPVILEAYPETAYLNVRNDLITVDSDTSTKWDYGRERSTNNGWFEGQYRIQSGETEKAITVHNPTRFTAFALKEYLERSGIAVAGDAMDADDLPDSLDYSGMQKVFSYLSHPMSDIISKVNRPSQNYIAETLQKTLGVEFGEKGSSWQGRQVEMAVFDSLGMDTRYIQLRDGSGLSRHNLVTPNSTASLLQVMWQHPYRTYYVESLPLSGVTGTIRKRTLGSTAEGNVRAKTGYIGYARALSGYTWTRSGEPLIFSIMVNNYTIPTWKVNALQDRIVTILSDMD